MKSDLTTVFEFLQQMGPEVTGRQTAEPDAHTSQVLERFARGECDQDERAEICQMLREHPAWMHWLASHVVLARSCERESPEEVTARSA